jgi:hypothetical protein
MRLDSVSSTQPTAADVLNWSSERDLELMFKEVSFAFHFAAIIL